MNINIHIDINFNIDIPPPPNPIPPLAPSADGPSMGWGLGGVISIFILIQKCVCLTETCASMGILCACLEQANGSGTHYHLGNRAFSFLNSHL